MIAAVAKAGREPGSYLAPAEAARVLGVSGARVRQMVAEGKLPALMTPLGRLLPAGAVEDEARRRAEKGGGKRTVEDASP